MALRAAPSRPAYPAEENTERGPEQCLYVPEQGWNRLPEGGSQALLGGAEQWYEQKSERRNSRLNMRPNFFTVTGTEHWNRLP